MEIYKYIKNYENHYRIISSGNILSLKKSIPKIMKQHISNTGYKSLRLTKNNISKTFCIHRLLAEAFIPNPENKRTVNHKDGNKLNNSLSNLEWATHAENNQHAIDLGLRKKAVHGFGAENASSKGVYQYNISGVFIKEFGSMVEAKTETGAGHISSVCIGSYKSSGGYLWRYENENFYGSNIKPPIKQSYLLGMKNELNQFSKKVFRFDLEWKLIDIFPSTSEAQRQLGIDKSHIAKVCRGVLKTSGGFKWSYSERGLSSHA